jgi:hypothetical protein
MLTLQRLAARLKARLALLEPVFGGLRVLAPSHSARMALRLVVPSRQFPLRLRIEGFDLHAALPQHLVEHLLCLAEDPLQTLPEGPIVDIP